MRTIGIKKASAREVDISIWSGEVWRVCSTEKMVLSVDTSYKMLASIPTDECIRRYRQTNALVNTSRKMHTRRYRQTNALVDTSQPKAKRRVTTPNKLVPVQFRN
jgi:hypothetical protein